MKTIKILLNILTHGDELVGLKVAEKIKQRYPPIIGNGLDIQVANEQARRKSKRYIDKDLNRVFPGNPNGSYEEKRAHELKTIVASYDLVIDIHSTESGSEDIVIVTKFDSATKDLLRVISPRRVLFMNMKPDNSLLSCAKVGIAFEMGKDKNPATFQKTIQGVEVLLAHFGLIPPRQNFGYSTEYFEVFASVPKPFGAILEPHIKNFSPIKKGEVFARKTNGNPIIADSDFVPVIFSSAEYETIFGFAAKTMLI